MKISKLARAMSYIDDDLIVAANVYRPAPQKKGVLGTRFFAAVAAACMVFILAVGIIKPYTGTVVSTTSASMLPSPGDPSSGRTFFCFGGGIYLHFGESVSALPEGFALVGEVKNGYEPAADFAGNTEGEVYMNEADKTVAYIKPSGGDEYLKMELQK